MKHSLPCILASLCLSVPVLALAAEFTAENDTLRVKYNDVTHAFSVSDLSTGDTFLRDGMLDGGGIKAVTQPATDGVFGNGQQLAVTQADGSVVVLALYQKLPFLLITKEVKNSGPTELDVQKAVPAVFTLDLGKPANDLRTVGTGGLLPAEKNPGSYLFLACADPATRRGVVAGWLSQDRGSGTLFSNIKDGKVEFKAQLEHGHLLLAPGQSAKLDTLAIGCFPDARIGLEQFADAVKNQNHIKLRPPVATYCSWYAEGPEHGGAGNAKTTVELSKFIARELKPYGLGVIQIDAYWETGPRIGGVGMGFEQADPNGPYRDGMAPVAQALAKDGMTLGLWWLPFGRHHMTDAYKDRQHWFVKRPDGTPLRQHSFGGTCLDCTHPEVQEHLRTLAKNMRDWGVTYFKMDGLSTGAGVDHVYINDGYKDDNLSNCQPLHDRTKTHIEAMRLGLKTIRQGAGNEVFFSGCAATQNLRIYAGAIGLVDSMRVGPDFNHDGQGIRSGPLRGSRMYFMNSRIWWNDPDPCKVRTSSEGCVADPGINGAVTLNQARLTTSWVSLTGQFFLLSDWLPNLPQERLEVLRRTVAHHNATARPVDYFDNALANTWLVTDDKSRVRRDVIGLFNFYGEPLQVDYTCAKLGLDPAKTYHAFDFWANTPVADFSSRFKATVESNACRVISLRAVEDHPVLISTSRHVSSGILEVKQESWSGNALAGTSEVVGNALYELRIVGLRDGGQQWVPTEVTVSDVDQAAGVTVSHTLGNGLLRVTITSPVSREVKWRVQFTSGALQPGKIQSVKASAKGPYDPIMISWESNGPFHTITRDGTVIATGQFGQSYADRAAPRGMAHVYTVAIDGGEALPTEPVLMPDFPPSPPLPDVILDGLKPHSTLIGWGTVQPGKAIDGGPLTVAGQVCANGLGLHAPAELVYTRQPEWKRFVAHIGLNERQRSVATTTVVCKVVAENAVGEKKELAASPVMSFGAVEQFPMDVQLPADCAKVHLLVEDGGDDNRCDHANWGNAGFMK